MQDEIQKNIDVIIPVYNGEKFILEAIHSVVAQTLPPFQVIVVDDGSTDTTHTIVSEYADKSTIPIVLLRKENGGLSSARNTGIKKSTSEFIAFLDADDIWLPNKLEEQIKVFESTHLKNLTLVYCNYNVINESGVILYKNYKSPLNSKKMRGMVFEKLLERNQITSSGSGVLIKREVFSDIGLFDEGLRFGEDWDMWLRIAKKYEVDFSPATLVHIRKHNSNMTVSSVKTFKNELNLYKKWVPILGKEYPIPLFWADKITFRILSNIFKNNLLSELKSTLPKETRECIFRKSFGSFYAYIPIFFIRQILNVFTIPGYFTILIGLMRHRGK